MSTNRCNAYPDSGPNIIMVDITESILNKILFSQPTKDCQTERSSKKLDFFVINGRKGPRWIVPADNSLGAKVLADWQPYGFFSQIAWFLSRQMYLIGHLALLPNVKSVSVPIDAMSVFKLPKTGFPSIPVVYIGTPSAQQKAVITLVSENDGFPLAVLKVGLEFGARLSLKREARILELLDAIGLEGVPKLLAVDEENGRSWQSVVSGALTSRKLTKRHIDWLLSLPRSKKTTTFDKQKEFFLGLLKQVNYNLSPEQLTVLNKVLEQIEGQKDIPLVLVHGDFSPWNIKQEKNGKLAVIDWEDAILEGLPLWDLCHFYFMQEHLFSSSKQMKKFLSGAVIDCYLQALELDREDLMMLVRLYLLGTVLHKGSNCSMEYQEFLIKQISGLVVS